MTEEQLIDAIVADPQGFVDEFREETGTHPLPPGAQLAALRVQWSNATETAEAFREILDARYAELDAQVETLRQQQAWCAANAPVCIVPTLDKKSFEAICKTQHLPFVSTVKTPIAVVGKGK
jgi:hypothetical protein